jgi:hypothetical protein
MFLETKEVAVNPSAQPIITASEAITAMRAVNSLFKSIVSAVKDEAIIMEQVFPDAAAALAVFVTRVFEQRVQVSHLILEAK